MSTALYLKNTKGNGVHLNARDLIDTATPASGGFTGATGTVASGTEIPLNAATPTEIGEWISDRIDQEVSIAGLITFTMWFYVSNALANATLRVKLWKVTAGGSDIETLIGTFDCGTEAGTVIGTELVFTGTPVVPVLMAQRERFIVRLYAIPAPGQTMGGPYNANIFYATHSVDGFSNLSFTETFGLLGEGTALYLRDTTLSGVSGFLDLLPARETVFDPKTAVVNTASAGSNIQWTLTAGGAVAAWISPRVAFDVPSFTTPSPWPQCKIYAYESAAQANAQIRARLWKRNLAGTETLIWGPEDMGSELTTDSLDLETFGTNRMTASLAEDDRLVLRLYCHNFGTMGSGRTCTAKYNGLITGSPSAVIIGSNNIAFKVESEPNGAVGRIAGGLTMGGVGN